MDYQTLVDRIRAAMAASARGGLERGPDLSREYAQACREINKRLENCSVFLNNDNPSEAVRLADSTPHLLEVCRTLQFEEMEDWNAFCIQLPNMELAEPLLTSVIDRLQVACFSTDRVEPLLKQFRLSSLRRSPIEIRLQILYQLTKLVPDNMTWQRLIPSYEERCEQELTEIFHSIRETPNGWRVVQEILAIIKGLSWRKSPKTLLAELERWSREGVIQRTNEELRTVANQMHYAQIEQDFEKLKVLESQRQQLMSKNCLTPRQVYPEIAELFEQPLLWLRHRVEEEKCNEEYEHALDNMEDAIDACASEVVLQKCFDSLKLAARKSSREIPEDIIEDIESVRSYHLRKRRKLEQERVSLRRKKRRLIYAICFSVLTTIAFVIMIGMRRARELQFVESESARMSRYLDSFDRANAIREQEPSYQKTIDEDGIVPDYKGLEKGEAFATALRTTYPKLAMRSVFQKLFTRLDETKKKEEERKEQFLRYMNRAEQSLPSKEISVGFRVEQLDTVSLNMAKLRVRTRDDYARYKAVEKKIEKLQSDIRRVQEGLFRSEIENCRREFERIGAKKGLTENDLNIFIAKKTDLEKLSSLGVAPALEQQRKKLLAECNKQIDLVRKNFKDEKLLQELKLDMERLAKSINEVDSYRNMLDLFVVKYAALSVAADLKKTLDNLEHQRVFDDWNRFAERYGKIWPLLGNASQQEFDMKKEFEQTLSFKFPIPQLDVMKRLLLEYTPLLDKKNGRDQLAKSVISYLTRYTKEIWMFTDKEGNYYYAMKKPSKSSGRVAIKKSIFEDEDNEELNWEKINGAGEISIAAHCLLARELRSQVELYLRQREKSMARWDTCVEELLSKVINSSNTLDPIIKASILKNLLKILVEEPRYVKVLEPAFVLFNHVDYDDAINWFDPTNEQLYEQRELAKEILAGMPKISSMMKEIRDQREGDASLLSGRYKRVGLLIQEGSLWKILPRVKDRKISDTLFFALEVNGTNQVITLNANRDYQVIAPVEIQKMMIQGMPVCEKVKE